MSPSSPRTILKYSFATYSIIAARWQSHSRASSLSARPRSCRRTSERIDRHQPIFLRSSLWLAHLERRLGVETPPPLSLLMPSPRRLLLNIICISCFSTWNTNFNTREISFPTILCPPLTKECSRWTSLWSTDVTHRLEVACRYLAAMKTAKTDCVLVRAQPGFLLWAWTHEIFQSERESD